jgi:bifunctional UDP-N-acetylglucosamine pyrophosphorylase/glucosamine-1-phosphate N-acetyltransferase
LGEETIMDLNIVILAAGKGTRMRSTKAKVLHKLAGRALLSHVIDTARSLSPNKIVIVYGHDGDTVKETLDAPDLTWVLQENQLGTGHAVKEALPVLDKESQVLVLYGDVPLITKATLEELIRTKEGKELGLLTAELVDSTGYGRILRNSNQDIVGIVEEKDANEGEKRIKEINTGIMLFESNALSSWISELKNDNAQGEYYLTDCVRLAANDENNVAGVKCSQIHEITGVNNRVQLAELERVYQRNYANSLMLSGTTLADPERIDIRGQLSAGIDCDIDINCVFEGCVELGEGVKIGPNVVITNSSLGDGTVVLANSVIENAQIGKDTTIGPFARIRPETVLADKVKIGNFVEIKKSIIEYASKVNHLSYIGDTKMGSGVNIGAGTITCNYDGAFKHQTDIGNNAFIGSDTQLVAPVKVGEGATIGAGSTITKDTPDQKLTLSRSKQITIDGWERPKKDA